MSVLYIEQIQTTQFRINNNIVYGSRKKPNPCILYSLSSLKAWKNLQPAKGIGFTLLKGPLSVSPSLH